uniref:cytochrome oxidase subunit II n=1 Tax=Ayyaria chaetophora TaxID=1291247 RepID=UPI0030E0E88C
MNIFDIDMYLIFENSSLSICVMQQFHDFTMMFLSLIMTFILSMMIFMKKSKFYNYLFKENMNLEIIWTIIPMIILFLIAYPSIFYLYLFDLNLSPSFSTKVFGAQWYWMYENFNQSSILKESYMTNDLELIQKDQYKMGWRLLDTDTRLSVPYGTEIQFITTSLDVIHAFSVPELGIKMDAVPGRLNSMNVMITKPGMFFGQCAEICGTGHSFMPICMEAI